MEHAERHGTTAQFQKEIKLQGWACELCTQANRDYLRSWRIRTGRLDTIKVPITLLRDLCLAETRETHELVLVSALGPLTARAILEGDDVADDEFVSGQDRA